VRFSDSVWPNLYASITARCPRVAIVFRNFFYARYSGPTGDKCVLACVSSGGGMIENPIFVPTLSFWPILKKNHSSNIPRPSHDWLKLLAVSSV